PSRHRGWKATQTNPTSYRKESRHCRSAALSMRGNHPGFPLIPSSVVGAAGFTPAATHKAFRRQAPRVEGYSDKPNVIPEGEQTLPQCGTVDERTPSRVSSHTSHLHHLGLFSRGEGVDLFDLRLRDLLQAGVRALGVVLRDLALLLHLVDPVQLVAPHVADRDASLLGLLLDELDVLAPALFRQWRDGDADERSVVGRVQSLLVPTKRLLDGADLALVVDLHDQQPGLGRADLRQLVERRGGAVVRNHDPIDQRRVGATGADGGQLGPEVVHRLGHLGLSVAKNRVDHVAAPTSVPISSPRITRSML